MENNLHEAKNQLEGLANGAMSFMGSLKKEVDKMLKDPKITPEQKEIIKSEWEKANFEGERGKLTKALHDLKSFK